MRLAGVLIAAALIAAPVAQAQTTPVQRKEVIEALAAALEKNYVYPEIGAKYAALLREKVASVDYAVADDFEFAKKVQADLDTVNTDRHLRLLAPLPPAGAGGPRTCSRNRSILYRWRRRRPSSMPGLTC